MATALRDVLGFIRRAVPREAGPSDGELLSRFAAARDEAAFAALLGRHGPLVLSVCRRVLGHEQDAEDAFQATFLVLACKAGSVAGRESVGSWLYGVAFRTATRARRAGDRRRRREAAAASPPQAASLPTEPQDWEALYEELDRIPEKYRAALVLCDIQGRSRQEAAAQLGMPEGTLSSRLATARRMLGDRLTRRGLGLAVGALAASAAVPDALASSTSSLAALVAAGQLAAVEASAAFLAKGVLRAMVMTKLKFALAAAAALAVVTGGASLRWGPAPAEAQQPPPAKAGKPLSELEELRQENELLKVNLRVLLEKVRRLEGEPASRKGLAAPGADAARPGGRSAEGPLGQPRAEDHYRPRREDPTSNPNKSRNAPSNYRPGVSSESPPGAPPPARRSVQVP
jgi:RNA polymerase sigma factor (sigma-70 family)